MHQAEQLKDLEKESDRLKRLFADAEPDQSILRLERVVVKTLSMEPGSPRENGYVESFNGKLRDELLACEEFGTLLEGKALIECWRKA